MVVSELKKRLDEIAWQEQVEHELSDRGSSSSPPDLGRIGELLRTLAEAVDVTLLDAIEKEEGYLVWALRLAPFVDPAHAKQRARPYLRSENFHVRYWARTIERL
jgi:hypothetical protein